MMNTVGHYTNIIKVGNSKGIRIPKSYLSALGDEVVLEKTNEGILIRPAGQIPPLKEWGKLFAAADTSNEADFDEWEITQGDGIE